MSSAADALYRLCLRTLPADVRRDFGDDMVQMFRDCRDSERGRPLRLVSLWAAAMADVLTEAIGARFVRATVSRSGSASSTRFSSFKRSTGVFMRSAGFDIRHGIRLLRHYPATSLLALATLALGIGANTAIFSVIDTVLLRSLPYPEPDRVVMLQEQRPRESAQPSPVSPADFLDWRSRNTSFASMAGYQPASITITGLGEPRQVMLGLVSASFFDILKTRPEAGRTFVAPDETIGQNAIVVLSHGFWQQHYGGAPDAVGKNIEVNGFSFRIIGVLPASFRFIDDSIQMWTPLVFGPQPTRVSHYLDVYARLKDGVTMSQAVDEMNRIGAALQTEHPAENNGHGPKVAPIKDRYVQDVRTSLVILFAAVGFVLLIACVNVANLQLARAISRGREMAVRAAIGASRARLIGQSLIESVTLSLAGGIAGTGLAVLLLKALPAVMPARLSLVGLEDLRLDLRVLFFALALSIATGVIFGLLPALHASRPALNDTLKAGGRSTAGVRRRARIGLVVGEVALASLTLFGAGLVVRSFIAMRSQPLGFEPSNRLTMSVGLAGARYREPATRQVALEDIETRLAAIPGVTTVGAVDILPLSGGNSRQGVGIEGRERKPEDPPTRMHPRVVTPGYFEAMGIPIVQGRAFSAEDATTSMPVVIINEAAVRQYWPDGKAVGTRVMFGGTTEWRTVVGVSRDVRHWGQHQEVNPMIYWPQTQAQRSYLTFVLKSQQDPGTLTNAARAAVAAVDPRLPLSDVRTLDSLVAKSLQAERAQSVLMMSFGVLALVLAVIGIYGVTSQLVTARVHDIGVRMTLGAQPRNILMQLLAEGLWQTAAGLAIGLGAGLLLLRITALKTSLLYQIQPWDPVTIAGVVFALAGAAVAACLIPGRRAMRVDPVQALRQS
jgi:putative ABC transport system permease protein